MNVCSTAVHTLEEKVYVTVLFKSSFESKKFMANLFKVSNAIMYLSANTELLFVSPAKHIQLSATLIQLQ
jgi:hypothetical protein